jgi:hypothetical protein
MQLRKPLRDYFGTADTESLLDESVYSSQELKEDKIRLKRQRQSIQKEMDNYAQEYKALLQKGADADSLDRQRIAQKAKMAKKKYKIKKQQYKKNSLVLGTVVTIEGARELMEMHDGANQSNIEDVLQTNDIDADQVQEEMMDQMIQFELDMDVMQEVQQSLDLDIMSSDMSVEGGDAELEKMEEMAAGNMSEEQVDLDAEVQVDEEESMSAEIEIEDLDEAENNLGF